MSKAKREKTIWLVLLLAWMGFIFYMSAQPAEVSAEGSGRVSLVLIHLLRPGSRVWPYAQQVEAAEKINYFVRKAAHMFEYAVLGGLFFGFFTASKASETSGKQPQKRGFFALAHAWLFATLYAATDEFHQYFVPGRSCELKDVLIDSTGAFLGGMLMLLIFGISGHFQKKRGQGDHENADPDQNGPDWTAHEGCGQA